MQIYLFSCISALKDAFFLRGKCSNWLIVTVQYICNYWLVTSNKLLDLSFPVFLLLSWCVHHIFICSWPCFEMYMLRDACRVMLACSNYGRHCQYTLTALFFGSSRVSIRSGCNSGQLSAILVCQLFSMVDMLRNFRWSLSGVQLWCMCVHGSISCHQNYI